MAKQRTHEVTVPPSRILCPHDFEQWTNLEAAERRAGQLRDELHRVSRNRDAWRTFARRCVAELLTAGIEVPEGEPRG